MPSLTIPRNSKEFFAHKAVVLPDMHANRIPEMIWFTDDEDTLLHLAASKAGMNIQDFICTATRRYAEQCEPEAFDLDPRPRAAA